MKHTRENIWQESLAYIVESRKFIYLAVLLFLLSGLLGFLFPNSFTFFDETLKELAHKTDGLGPIGLILFIFGNNIMSSFVALFFGAIIGIVPFFNILVNGALVGYVLARAIDVAGVSVVLKLVPHGIFELPAIFIAIGLGMRWGMFVFRPNKKKAFLARGMKSLKVFLVIIVPLLVIAAIIEGLFIAYS
jgi:stage II sporulation protein M